ncbi:MAG: sigma-70 family RNA polymerase sigma factor [Gemmataceae bacterium]|nr:sigma-70 family RNA polymerase sigma factor [Gemmataceae bacterium]
MARPAGGLVLHFLRRIFDAARPGGCPEHELLQRFLCDQDRTAFEGLLRCHGPMVLDVCRSVLGNEADAEDAFQATFLVLAGKAQSIRNTASLASWLYGVAYRTALKARADAARRRKYEQRVSRPVRVEAADELTWREVRQVLHEELNRLAERFRAPLVLCYLQGKSQDQAAAELALPKGMLRGRLERGREQLRRRLVRRGLGPTAALAASALPAATASAALPSTLVAPTVKAAAGVVTGQGASGLVSAPVVALSRDVLKAMFGLRIKLGSILLLTVALGAGGLLLYRATAEVPPKAERARERGGEVVRPERAAADAQPPIVPPVVWEEDFENGLPKDCSGRFVQDGLPRGSRGAAAAVRMDRGTEGVFFQIATPKLWDQGLFAVQNDSHFHFTFKMDRPGWMNVFLIARHGGHKGQHSGNYLFNDPHFWPRQPGQWRTLSIPFAQFRRAGSGQGPPPSATEVPYMVLFSSLADRGLVIDRMWVTRGGPGVVQCQDVD